jgi:flagellar motor switch protein FliN
MSNVDQEQAAAALLQHFAEAASTVLSQIAGSELAAQPSALESPIEAATLIRIAISGSLDGLAEIALSAPMTAEFSALLMGETADPSAEITNDHREAAAELIQQICGNAADRLRAAFGPLEVKSQLAERDAESGERHRFVIAREPSPLEFEFHIVRLVAPVVEEPAPSAAAAAPEPTAIPEPAAAAVPVIPAAMPAAALPVAFNSRNLDLLLDIELGVTLRFGSRQMLLKEILELSSGSVVELDRRVEEPVEMLIDGRVIARGEVVIVGGNYGLRILQVASEGEKVACLP